MIFQLNSYPYLRASFGGTQPKTKDPLIASLSQLVIIMCPVEVYAPEPPFSTIRKEKKKEEVDILTISNVGEFKSFISFISYSVLGCSISILQIRKLRPEIKYLDRSNAASNRYRTGFQVFWLCSKMFLSPVHF